VTRFSATAAPAKAPADSELVTSRRGHFWVGAGERGPMYVYWEAPPTVTKPYPIVMVHGGGGQGLDYLSTPDGRPGWSTLLVQQGWVVYVVDRPGHGRSPYVPDTLGPMGPALPLEVLTSIFVPPTDGPAAMPFAPLHTQWPGDRNDPADRALLQFLASGGPFAADAADRQALEQSRLSQLLDQVGPAFVISNSLGGPSGFLVADARPDLVVGLVQHEPIGPAFSTNFGPDTLRWGLSAAPVAYEPPAASPDDLNGGEGRTLTNISKVPIAVVSGEASVFRFSNPPLVEFLLRMGCDAVHIDLPEHGVRGNSHGAMFEKNNADVLAVITTWMTNQLK
jgi:pimeloyl-ACP methyl ester carboxylesterase